jgi:CheY-like chemotaxis protein
MMGGRIKAESRVDQGTKMVVEIPFKKAESEPHTVIHPTTTETLSTWREGNKVLLVDDNRMNQHLGTTLLSRLGCEVSVAHNGQEAVEMVRQKRFPIIFLDCQMPVMDGYDATREIRRLEAAKTNSNLTTEKPITIIALTADVTKESRKRCFESGMDDFLHKPVNQGHFREMLTKYAQA